MARNTRQGPLEQPLRIVRRDEALLERLAAHAQDQGKPVLVRVQPAIYDYATDHYRGWQGVSNTLEVATAEDARQFRDALELFFLLTERLNPAGAAAYLRQVHAKLDEQVAVEDVTPDPIAEDEAAGGDEEEQP